MSTQKRTTLADAPRVPPRRRQKHLTIDQWKKVVKVLSERSLRDRALFFLMYEAGMRRSEPGVLRGSYLTKLKHNQVYIFRGKDSDQGYVDVTPTTADLLRLWVRELNPPLTQAAPVFPGYRGLGISGNCVYTLWREICEQANVPGRPHMLKHSRCQHLLEKATEAGQDPMNMLQTIAQIVGHKKAMTTIQHYMSQTSKERRFVMNVTKELVKEA